MKNTEMCCLSCQLTTRPASGIPHLCLLETRSATSPGWPLPWSAFWDTSAKRCFSSSFLKWWTSSTHCLSSYTSSLVPDIGSPGNQPLSDSQFLCEIFSSDTRVKSNLFSLSPFCFSQMSLLMIGWIQTRATWGWATLNSKGRTCLN